MMVLNTCHNSTYFCQ